MGRLLGNLKSLTGTALGGHAIRAALERGGVRPDQVEYVIMGQVLQAGAGQITARQAAVAAGIPMTTPALTVKLRNEHFGYALTWFGLAAVLLGVFFVWIARRERP